MQVTFGGNSTKVNRKHCERFQNAKSYYVVSGSPDVDGTISAKFHASVYARSDMIVRKFTQCQNCSRFPGIRKLHARGSNTLVQSGTN